MELQGRGLGLEAQVVECLCENLSSIPNNTHTHNSGAEKELQEELRKEQICEGFL